MMLYELDDVETVALLGGGVMGSYEGEYRCAVSEDGPCRKEGSMVYREPFTPAQTRVIACSECADALEKQGYHFDEEATVQLARDREREKLIGV